MTSELRALVGARVSVIKGPEKVSHEAQHRTGAKWATDNGCAVVGTFEDLDISADKYDPWRRPDLGQWLSPDRLHEWDVIIWSKIDRAFRSIRDSVKFAEWARENRKIVVFAEDGLKLDYLAPQNSRSFEAMLAELFVYLGAFFGQMELNRFRSRALDAHSVLRTTNRWASGVPPLGYVAAPHPSGKGMGLVTDPEAKELLHEMASRLIGGWSYVRIAVWLTEIGALSARDRARVRSGKPIKSRHWTTTNVKRILTSYSTQGFKIRVEPNDRNKIHPVLDESGEMIRMAPPTFDDETWEQLQAAAKARSVTGKRRRHSPNMLLRIGWCGKCGTTLSWQISWDRTRTLSYKFYRCGRSPVSCTGITTPAEPLEEALTSAFLLAYGDWKVREQVFVPGTDNRVEIERIKGSLSRLRRESDAGIVDDEELWLQRMKALTVRLREMEKQPYTPSEWKQVEGDQTYREAWPLADVEAKRKMLSDARAEVHLYGREQVEIKLDYLALHQAASSGDTQA